MNAIFATKHLLVVQIEIPTSDRHIWERKEIIIIVNQISNKIFLKHMNYWYNSSHSFFISEDRSKYH